MATTVKLPDGRLRNTNRPSLPVRMRGCAAEPGPRPEQTAKLLLTSGSTGRPKAVIQTHAGIAVNAAQITACFDDPERADGDRLVALNKLDLADAELGEGFTAELKAAERLSFPPPPARRTL